MQAGEGMLTQVEGTDCGKELKQEEEKALEELRNPECLKGRQSGARVSRTGGKPRKISLGLAAPDVIICIFRLFTSADLNLGCSQNHLILIMNNTSSQTHSIRIFARGTQTSLVSKGPQAFPLDSQG